jgi:hypothetical protein
MTGVHKVISNSWVLGTGAIHLMVCTLKCLVNIIRLKSSLKSYILANYCSCTTCSHGTFMKQTIEHNMPIFLWELFPLDYSSHTYYMAWVYKVIHFICILALIGGAIFHCSLVVQGHLHIFLYISGSWCSCFKTW